MEGGYDAWVFDLYAFVRNRHIKKKKTFKSSKVLRHTGQAAVTPRGQVEHYK